ncbi:UDP-N-acetylmuramoyl-L-alanyl-D-glutamate--2,6-diaminopimelate ligase [Shewanella alkalitolerans]|uniref:UDP-N-acetylmuramoyl-L-alanyl-D-glutamate--2, 6-diaminopimelate ligase n=1 Tax=Shewanella alkalitolerans TaxID=2864209 RepID=UPI001C65C8A7|nr:UDP-N-acetylmuramoyl-L-alanyl-D-glutamate--2,6-diaminopimelate ligase [Shewanella alkalitolerans]QYJ99723.1 UDP-N-acetylmuramoyl-L-alanyl-D-glutamate--2,6-diaminopimelate ligase [Shewanella alkalitolerans]
MMQLCDLLAPWFHYAGGESLSHLTLDSREIGQGSVFVAVPGHRVDGRDYVDTALSQGAVAALIHTDDPAEHGKVSQDNGLRIYFFQLQRQLSALASQLYVLGRDRIKLIGVTGTNGKTSVTQLIAQLSDGLGKPAAVMGTLGNGLWGQLVDSGNTTADPITVMRQLEDFDRQGTAVCAMEVSSHGLVQGRVDAVPFDVAVFTNLSRDHLDYHGSMDAYGAAKQRLFRFSSLSHGLINLDDPVGRQWIQDKRCKGLVGFSIQGQEGAAIYTKEVKQHSQGVSATLVWPEGEAKIDSPLLGIFNLSNLVAALGALYLSGYAMAQLLTQVSSLKPVAGRMERFTTQEGVTLVVDYAHTPDAIEQALRALRGHCRGKLWCVFGCGGDRDKGKRPLMARAAEENADCVMVTSDNARSEDPMTIIQDVLAGLNKPQIALTQVDRQQAIREVVTLASSGDLILLAGKGHETYQEIAGKRLDYDERALAAAIARGGK